MIVRPPRILAPRQADTAFDALQHEVLQEKASTLGRLTQAFESALAELRRFEAETGASRSEDQDSRREALLDAAADALWIFVVQREACGLRNTEAVLRDYGVPTAVRLRMGVHRRR